jgi:hypothetical protein
MLPGLPFDREKDRSQSVVAAHDFFYASLKDDDIKLTG